MSRSGRPSSERTSWRSGSLGGALAVAAEQPAVAPRQRKHRAAPARAGQRLHRTGQPGFAAGALAGSARRKSRRARSRSRPARRACSRVAGSAGSRRMRTQGCSSWPARLNHHGARRRVAGSCGGGSSASAYSSGCAVQSLPATRAAAGRRPAATLGWLSCWWDLRTLCQHVLAVPAAILAGPVSIRSTAACRAGCSRSSPRRGRCCWTAAQLDRIQRVVHRQAVDRQHLLEAAVADRVFAHGGVEIHRCAVAPGSSDPSLRAVATATPIACLALAWSNHGVCCAQGASTSSARWPGSSAIG